jgi:hypothetical protein
MTAVCKTVGSTCATASPQASQTLPSWSGFAPEWLIWASCMRAVPGQTSSTDSAFCKEDLISLNMVVTQGNSLNGGLGKSPRSIGVGMPRNHCSQLRPKLSETEAQVRDRVVYYLDTAIELVTQQATRQARARSGTFTCCARILCRDRVPGVRYAPDSPGNRAGDRRRGWVWEEGHQRAAYASERGSAAPRNGEDLQLPDIK